MDTTVINSIDIAQFLSNNREGATVFYNYDKPPNGGYVIGGVRENVRPANSTFGEISAEIYSMTRWATSFNIPFDTIGIWEHNNSIYLDLGTWTANKGVAHVLAHSRRELSYYDRTNETCIDTTYGKDNS